MAPSLYPPGPKGHWLSGHLPFLRRDRLNFLTRCAREHGDVVGLRFGPRRVYLVSHPDLIEEVLVAQNQNFIKHFALRLNPLLLGNGLLTSEGNFWLRQRRLVQPAFNRSRLASYAPAMVQATERLLRDWRPGEERNIHAEMMKLTLGIAAKTLFNAEADNEAREVAQAMRVLQENFSVRFQGLLPLPLWVPTPSNLRTRRAVHRLDELIYRFIRERRQQRAHGQQLAHGTSPAPAVSRVAAATPPTNLAQAAASSAGPDTPSFTDLLSLLLQAQDEDDGGTMTDQQVRDEAMTLFLAGHETTALALSWTWYLLARHPHVEDKLVREVREVVGGRLPVFEDAARLRYTEAVVLESMRLYPPAYVIGREAIQDTTLGGYPVQRGLTLLMSQWVVQRDPRFFPDADTFRPERWLGDDIKKLPKFAYFPFGGGPRLCVGNTFAMLEMALVLATIAASFRFVMQPGKDAAPVATFTLHPADGVPGLIVPR